MTEEDLRLTKRYLSEYDEFCKNRECGEGCPVYDEHVKTPKISCFKIYCSLRESGKLS